jgi:hypothetical protein
MACKFFAFKYAVAKSLNASLVCGILRMRLNAGKSKALDASFKSLGGSEDAVMRTLLNG